jgi:dTDP-4-dehydrorhamnose reductase
LSELISKSGSFFMINNVKLLVVGATGYIGKNLYSKAKGNLDVLGTSSDGGDGLLSLRLDRPTDFNFELLGPSSVVLLTAAISSPDICARENARAWAVNVTGTSEFIKQAIAHGARVVFFSSDTVYGQDSNTLDESAAIHPAGEYAEMKSDVEKNFLGNPSFKAIRLSYVFSREDKFTKYLVGCAERGQEAELFHPFYRAIVHRDDVVEGALALAERWDEFSQKVINFGGPEVLSRIDFADCLKSGALPNLMYRVTAPEDDFFNNRPRAIAMSANIFPELLGRPSHRLREAVRIEYESS